MYLVTGGAGTLAIECTRALLEHGLLGVAILDLDPDRASKEIETLRRDFPNSKVVTGKIDVRDAASVSAAVTKAVEELGSVSVLCCFAGVVGCTHALEMTPDEWRRTMDINSTGCFLAAQAVARWAKSSFQELTENHSNLSQRNGQAEERWCDRFRLLYVLSYQRSSKQINRT